ncbi:AAA family ATPase [uncultured Clostridium sp.]|uniref:AAA family ATPase n=1 Tax=uncultured Clostridium sp. TaxID=59620 RepID=UPI003217DD41
MKPISLKIKGLNSFNEEQFIDFENLTEQGFFGIFGPTGSGKSTVLDGITLALYGEVSRKSSNFININCDSLALSYTFQISGVKPKRYMVDREFKRDKKTGNPISGKCKIIDITSDEPIILADKVKEVTIACREIIGLSLDDFTRTVVLPQGKFSEFLKLEGRARRDMLERLFNLQKYGDNLSGKLKAEIAKKENKYTELSGELKGYENINEDTLKEKEDELKNSTDKLIKGNEELKKLEADFKEKEEVWKLILDIKAYEEKKENLMGKAQEIEGYKEKLKIGEGAARVLPYVENYENTLRDLKDSKEKENTLNLQYEKLKVEKDELQSKWDFWRNKKDKKLPDLKVKEEKVKDSLIEKKNLDALKVSINELKESVKSLKEHEQKAQGEINILGERILKGGNVIKETEEKFQALKIDSELKEKVQRGIRLNERYVDLKTLVDKDKLTLIKLKKFIEEEHIKEGLLTKELNKKEAMLKEKEEALENLISTCPGESTDLLNLQRRISDEGEKARKHNLATEDIKNSEEIIKKLREAVSKYQETKASIDETIKGLKTEILDLQVETLASELRENLNKGEPCPVCGSLEHHVENIRHIEILDINEKNEKLHQLESHLKEIEMNITRDNTKILNLEENIKAKELEIKALGDDFKVENLVILEDRFKVLDKELSKYNKDREVLDNFIKVLKEEKLSLESKRNIIKSVVEEKEKHYKDVELEYNKNTLSCSALENDISNIKTSINVENFQEKNEEILRIEKEREELEKNIRKYRKALDDLIDNKESIQISLNSLRENLAKEKSALIEKEKSAEEKELQIKAKVGDMDNLKDLLMHLQEEIKTIEDSFNSYEKKKELMEEEFKNCNETLIDMISKVRELDKREVEEKNYLEAVLKKESFESCNQVKESIISKEETGNLKKIIEEYNNSVYKVNGAIESLLIKINGRKVSKEAWLQIQEEKAVKEEEIKALTKVNIRYSEEVNHIKKKLVELKGLLDKKEKLDHKLALLDDLEKLFKGKKFVEFVAATRLKYVSMEASKRLKEITSGTYGLEVDEQGKFIIRDYKNGGASRDASTLSGGETFLTSLALALALSSEIQLKGTAPLELFFLDEGFGTLDDDLLEVVMSSLEKIHNDKLKVGIISHVESIKNRVPVKLVLTPAEAGRGGSKVKIERS